MENRVDELLRSSSNYLGNIKCDITKSTAPFKCAVDICKNKFTSIESHQLAAFKFHDFPKCHVLRQKWKALCNLPPEASVRELKVCSDHFNLDDYYRNLKEEFLHPDRKRGLKDDALPFVNITPGVTEEKLIEYVNTNISSADEVFQSWQIDSDSKEGKVSVELSDEALILKRDIKCLQQKIKCTKDSIRRKSNNLAQSRKSWKKIDIQVKKNTHKILRSFLSDAQIKILKGKKKVFWSDDDLAQAFTLRHMGGKDFYLYMKNTLNYPLPALSCVQAWAGNDY